MVSETNSKLNKYTETLPQLEHSYGWKLTVYIDEANLQLIVPLGSVNTFDYYLGGEYIDKKYVTTIGNYVFYSYYSERVRDLVGLVEDDGDDDYF